MSGYHCIEVRSDSLCKQVARIAQELAWSETNSSGNPELPVLREDGVSCLMNVHVSPPGGSHDAHMEGAYTYSACMYARNTHVHAVHVYMYIVHVLQF